MSIGRRLALALALSTAMILPAAPAFAGKVELLPPLAQTPATYPGAEPGHFRTWVQLVWNPIAHRLERLSFTAWDPVPSLGLELSWQPDDPASTATGPLEGRGTLSFRTPGAAAYDAAATKAQYRGSFKAGRPDGVGEFLDQSGFAYLGGWRDGLMDGQGRLTLANGDEYVGAFRAGKRDGDGTLTDAAGQIYEGRFAADRPDGGGILVPSSGVPYAADWSAGSEIPGTRHAVPPGASLPRIVKADYPDVPGLRIGVVAERRPRNFQLQVDPLSYTSRADGQGLDILPDDQRLLDVWHGTAPITMTQDELRGFLDASTTPSFLGPWERFDPLSLVFSLENGSTDTVSVVGGFIDVTTSDRDPEPALQAHADEPQQEWTRPGFMPKFDLDNFGWTSADNPHLSVVIGSEDGRPAGPAAEVPIDPITQTSTVDVTPQLAALGLDIGVVSTSKLHCTDPSDERLCLNELRRSGHFGQLGDFISLDSTTVTINAKGTLDYDWSDAVGMVAHKTSTFELTLPIADVSTDAEGGEGGEIVEVRHDPFQLHLGDKGYHMALPFAADVTPGFTTRWRIELSAAETSQHDFRIVLLTADGRQIASRPIHLTYFMPSKLAAPTPID